MSRPELARRSGVGRTTAYRWEEEGQVPENLQVVERVAEVLGLDLNEALEAAGLRPAAEPPVRPARQERRLDPKLEDALATLYRMLEDPNVSAGNKAMIRSELERLKQLPQWVEPEPAERREAAG